jgi:hypothetical protein
VTPALTNIIQDYSYVRSASSSPFLLTSVTVNNVLNKYANLHSYLLRTRLSLLPRSCIHDVPTCVLCFFNPILAHILDSCSK